MKSEYTTASYKNLFYLKRAALVKLATLLLLFTCFKASAYEYTKNKITIRLQAAELKKALVSIEKVSDYHFLYNQSVIANKPKVSIDVADADIATVLDILLNNTGISYRLLENNLVVLKGENESKSFSPEIRVSGKVTGTANEALPGVSVTLKGTSVGTTTDASGNYALTVPDEGAVLVFSSVGFSTQEIPVNGRTTINVTMSASASELNTVVVVGYGTQRKRDLTGSISSVRGEELAKLPNTNPIASLQGRVPGLTIANSGNAGASPVVRIRGINSTNSANPVYVVDGILQDNIDYLNPADIESIDILRDPSSIAIYGLRGANGVIAVTLKRAARGRTVVNFQSSVGIQTVPKKIDVADAAGFKKLLDQQLINQGGTSFDFTNYTADNNWQDLILRDAVITTNNLSISNSGEKSTTVFNLGYTYQDGVLRNDNFQRYLVRLGQEIRLSDNIKIGGDITGYHFINNPAAASITNALWAAPVVPVQFDENTYYSMISLQRAQVGNPIATLRRNDRNTVEKGYRAVGNIFAEIRFLRNFTWRSTIYGDFTFNTGRSYGQLPFRFVDLGEGATPTATRYDSLVRTTVTQEQGESRKFQQDHTLTFDKRFGDHSLNVVAGLSTIYTTNSFVNGFRRDTLVHIPDDPVYWYLGITNPNNPTTNGGGGAEGALVGTFARASYSYRNRYLLNLTIRRDGSSKFAPENRWGTFGSVGAGWVVSDETFFDNVKTIDFLKLRFAWGLTGNANGFAENLWRPGIQNSNSAVFGDNVYPAIQAAYIVDPNLHWETVRGMDIGVDIRALKRRLNLEITYYDRTTTDILTQVTIPNDSRRKFTNLGDITNKGVEISAGWNGNLGRDFTYNVSANYSYNKNVVNSIGDNFNFEITGNGGINLTRTGQSIGYFYGYTQTGIYQTTADLQKTPAFANSLPGDISYKDMNGDGKIDQNDRSFLGSPFPDHNFGGSISLAYKGFDFQLDGQGMAGHKIYTQRRTANFAVLNWETNRLGAWTGPGTSNVEPILNSNRGNNYLFSTYYLEPGDFFRIRTLQIGYTFSQKLLSGIGVQRARIYANGQNIKTWSRVTGYSPEPLIGSILGGGADNGAYPMTAIYSVGINLTF